MVQQMTLLTGHLDSSKKVQESLLEALTRQQKPQSVEGKVDGQGAADTKGDTSLDGESMDLGQKNKELL